MPWTSGFPGLCLRRLVGHGYAFSSSVFGIFFRPRGFFASSSSPTCLASPYDFSWSLAMSSPLQSSEYYSLPVAPSPLPRHQALTECGSLGLALCFLEDHLCPRPPSPLSTPSSMPRRAFWSDELSASMLLHRQQGLSTLSHQERDSAWSVLLRSLLESLYHLPYTLLYCCRLLQFRGWDRMGGRPCRGNARRATWRGLCFSDLCWRTCITCLTP